VVSRGELKGVVKGARKDEGRGGGRGCDGNGGFVRGSRAKRTLIHWTREQHATREMVRKGRSLGRETEGRLSVFPFAPTHVQGFLLRIFGA